MMDNTVQTIHVCFLLAEFSEMSYGVSGRGFKHVLGKASLYLQVHLNVFVYLPNEEKLTHNSGDK